MKSIILFFLLFIVIFEIIEAKRKIPVHRKGHHHPPPDPENVDNAKKPSSPKIPDGPYYSSDFPGLQFSPHKSPTSSFTDTAKQQFSVSPPTAPKTNSKSEQKSSSEWTLPSVFQKFWYPAPPSSEQSSSSKPNPETRMTPISKENSFESIKEIYGRPIGTYVPSDPILKEDHPTETFITHPDPVNQRKSDILHLQEEDQFYDDESDEGISFVSVSSEEDEEKIGKNENLPVPLDSLEHKDLALTVVQHPFWEGLPITYTGPEKSEDVNRQPINTTDINNHSAEFYNDDVKSSDSDYRSKTQLPTGNNGQSVPQFIISPSQPIKDRSSFTSFEHIDSRDIGGNDLVCNTERVPLFLPEPPKSSPSESVATAKLNATQDDQIHGFRGASNLSTLPSEQANINHNTVLTIPETSSDLSHGNEKEINIPSKDPSSPHVSQDDFIGLYNADQPETPKNNDNSNDLTQNRKNENNLDMNASTMHIIEDVLEKRVRGNLSLGHPIELNNDDKNSTTSSTSSASNDNNENFEAPKKSAPAVMEKEKIDHVQSGHDSLNNLPGSNFGASVPLDDSVPKLIKKPSVLTPTKNFGGTSDLSPDSAFDSCTWNLAKLDLIQKLSILRKSFDILSGSNNGREINEKSMEVWWKDQDKICHDEQVLEYFKQHPEEISLCFKAPVPPSDSLQKEKERSLTSSYFSIFYGIISTIREICVIICYLGDFSCLIWTVLYALESKTFFHKSSAVVMLFLRIIYRKLSVALNTETIYLVRGCLNFALIILLLIKWNHRLTDWLKYILIVMVVRRFIGHWIWGEVSNSY